MALAEQLLGQHVEECAARPVLREHLTVVHEHSKDVEEFRQRWRLDAELSARESFCLEDAGDMIDSLTMTYNRTRQAVITKELIEIISGAEAL